jgi:hypothetical protein
LLEKLEASVVSARGGPDQQVVIFREDQRTAEYPALWMRAGVRSPTAPAAGPGPERRPRVNGPADQHWHWAQRAALAAPVKVNWDAFSCRASAALSQGQGN